MKYVNSILNTVWSEVLLLFRYKKSLVSDVIIFVSVYLGIIMLNDHSTFANFYNLNPSDGPTLLLIGYIVWSFSSVAFGYSSATIISDSRSGILELKIQGVVPYYIYVLCSVFVTLLESIIILFIVMIISLVGNLISFSSVGFIVLTVIFSIPSVLGMFGLGLILGGFALKEKSIGGFVSIISGVLLFLSNTFVLDLPKIIYILPFTSVIDFMRNLYSNSRIDTGLLAIYVLNALFWFITGIYIFNILLKKERVLGSFDNY